jgi:hypothetical protein
MIIKISALIYTLIAITVITLMIMRPPIDIATNQNTPSEVAVQNPTTTEASDIQATENSNNTIPNELPATTIPPMPVSVTPETAANSVESSANTTEAIVTPAMPVTPAATETVEVPIPSAVTPVDSNTAINPSPVMPSIPVAPSAPDTALTAEPVTQNTINPQVVPQSAIPVPANVIDTPLSSVLPENTTLN